MFSRNSGFHHMVRPGTRRHRRGFGARSSHAEFAEDAEASAPWGSSRFVGYPCYPCETIVPEVGAIALRLCVRFRAQRGRVRGKNGGDRLANSQQIPRSLQLSVCFRRRARRSRPTGFASFVASCETPMRRVGEKPRDSAQPRVNGSAYGEELSRAGFTGWMALRDSLGSKPQKVRSRAPRPQCARQPMESPPRSAFDGRISHMKELQDRIPHFHRKSTDPRNPDVRVPSRPTPESSLQFQKTRSLTAWTVF